MTNRDVEADHGLF